MNEHEKISYIEFPTKDMEVSKNFFTKVFNWGFTDTGPNYSAFSNAGIDGGFFKSEVKVPVESGCGLVVFYSEDLEKTQSKIKDAGGEIVKPIFPFPGGRQFSFSDPNGNVYAVFSNKTP